MASGAAAKLTGEQCQILGGRLVLNNAVSDWVTKIRGNIGQYTDVLCNFDLCVNPAIECQARDDYQTILVRKLFSITSNRADYGISVH